MFNPEQIPNTPSPEKVPREKQNKESVKVEKQGKESPEWLKISQEGIDLIEKSLEDAWNEKDEKRLDQIKNRLGERVFDFLEEEVLHAWTFLGKYQREGGKEKLDTSEIEERIQELKKMNHKDIDRAIRKMYGG